MGQQRRHDECAHQRDAARARRRRQWRFCHPRRGCERLASRGAGRGGRVDGQSLFPVPGRWRRRVGVLRGDSRLWRAGDRGDDFVLERAAHGRRGRWGRAKPRTALSACSGTAAGLACRVSPAPPRATTGNGTGVVGQSNSGVGVQGASNGNVGVLGSSSTSHGAVRGVGQRLRALRDLDEQHRHRGEHERGQRHPGRLERQRRRAGHSNSSIGGFFASGTSTGLYATGPASGFAARFDGPVLVNGNFTAIGGSKSAAVPHPDGTHRRLYCVGVAREPGSRTSARTSS